MEDDMSPLNISHTTPTGMMPNLLHRHQWV
jgi:hypothetical protein